MTTDFALTNNDLTITPAGDFAIGESDNQHLYDIINSFPGWWKQFPQVGVGIQTKTIWQPAAVWQIHAG